MPNAHNFEDIGQLTMRCIDEACGAAYHTWDKDPMREHFNWHREQEAKAARRRSVEALELARATRRLNLNRRLP